MEYLVSMVIELPPGIESHRRLDLYRREAEHARALAKAGMLRRLWRIPGRTENVGIWEAYNVTELHKALAGFPLWPYMQVTITELADNHNDPREGWSGSETGPHLPQDLADLVPPGA